jgi:CO dehydrogenase maturation factor
VGKTVVTALMARALRHAGVAPLLLIDADPVGGLVTALGERGGRTLASVRAQVIGAARHGDAETKQRVAEQLDYMVFEALTEREGYSLLAMGRTTEKGCFCPANTLLRKAIDVVVDAFAVTLVDAEAGIEQINRQVTERMTHAVVVTDGSGRSRDTLELIVGMLGSDRVSAVDNRARGQEPAWELPRGVRSVGSIPEDPALRDQDARGQSLWELPQDTPSLQAARRIVRDLGLMASRS